MFDRWVHLLISRGIFMNEICTRFYSFVIKINTRPAGRVHGIDTRPGLETLVPVERSSVNVAHCINDMHRIVLFSFMFALFLSENVSIYSILNKRSLTFP